MDTSKYLSSGKFAEFCGITKDALIWYEKKGLISPQCIGENGYHYYSIEQFFEIDLIKALKLTDKTLLAGRNYIIHRNPDAFLSMLMEQNNLLEEKISKLMCRKAIVEKTIQEFESMRTRFSTEPFLSVVPETHLLASPITDHSKRGMLQSMLKLFTRFHQYSAEFGIHSTMLNSFILPQDAFMARDTKQISHVCLKINQAIDVPEYRFFPERTCVVYYHCGQLDNLPESYDLLVNFIMRKGITPCGAAFEQDFINYMVSGDPSDYIKEISIPVCPASPE